MFINKKKLHLLQIAHEKYGTLEHPGREHNPDIIQFAHDIGLEWYQNDETEWCAIFTNWCLKQAGLKYLSSCVARHCLKLGKETLNPEIGDLVIYWRESKQSWKGHVGIFIRKVDNLIYTLGGNQSDMVCIKSYPSYRLLGYRDVTNVV